MRTLIFLLLTGLTVSAYCQNKATPVFVKEIGRSTDGLVKACLLVDQNGYGKELLIYRKGKAWDSLSIAREGESDMGDTCYIQTVQIDQKDLKEVVLSWSGQVAHSYGGETGGGFFNKFTRHEIWDLGSGKKLFAAQSEYYQEEMVGFYSGPDSSVLRSRTVTCSYEYNFSVTKEGKVRISNLKERNAVTYDDETVNRIKEEKNDCSFAKPDHFPGVYVYKNGKFHREGK